MTAACTHCGRHKDKKGLITMTKIYVYDQDPSGLISAAEADFSDISVAGLQLASITQVAELVRANGDASAFAGPILCRDGEYEYDYDAHRYVAL